MKKIPVGANGGDTWKEVKTMSTVIGHMAGQHELPEEVMRNFLALVASIQMAAQQGSLRPQTGPAPLDQSLLLESLIEEYDRTL